MRLFQFGFLCYSINKYFQWGIPIRNRLFLNQQVFSPMFESMEWFPSQICADLIGRDLIKSPCITSIFQEIQGIRYSHQQRLTHWGWVTHICVGKPTIIGSDNGLSPDRRQAIIWTNAGILLIAPLGTNFSEILNGIQTFSFKKMHLKMSSAKWRPFCLGLNVLKHSHKTQCGVVDLVQH